MSARIIAAASLWLAIAASAPSRAVAQMATPAGRVAPLSDTLGAEDRFRPDDPALPMGVSLYSYRVYDPQRKLWQIVGASSNGGAVQLELTWSDAAHRYVIQRAGRILVRMRYSAIAANHFLWRSDRSYDNGATWIRDFAVLEATRVGR